MELTPLMDTKLKFDKPQQVGGLPSSSNHAQGARARACHVMYSQELQVSFALFHERCLQFPMLPRALGLTKKHIIQK